MVIKSKMTRKVRPRPLWLLPRSRFTFRMGISQMDAPYQLARAGMKLLHPEMDVMQQHGPMFVIASVLIVAGIQLLALGLLGELQVRHYHSSQRPASYAVDRLVRLVSAGEQSLLSERQDGML